MVEGIVVGAIAAAAWIVILMVVASPWMRDRVRDGVREAVSSTAFLVVVFPAEDRAGDLADAHGFWFGYGSTVAGFGVVIAAFALVARRTDLFAAWQLYGITIGRVPPAKSRRTPKSRRAPRSQRV